MLKAMPTVSKHQQIRDEFARVGPMTTQAFARHCLDVGIWTQEDAASRALRSFQSEIRTALKSPDATGLPFAGQTASRDLSAGAEESDEPGGANIWAQRSFWNYEDYALNIREAVKQRDILDYHARELANECRERFGAAPSVTLITPN